MSEYWMTGTEALGSPNLSGSEIWTTTMARGGRKIGDIVQHTDGGYVVDEGGLLGLWRPEDLEGYAVRRSL